MQELINEYVIDEELRDEGKKCLHKFKDKFYYSQTET